MAGVGRTIGVIFCIMLLASTSTGGNMFQAWNVGELTQAYFGVPSWVTGIVLAIIVGSVILGGIKRIGVVTSLLVPFMVAMYLLAGTYVLIMNFGAIPDVFALIVTSAFSPTESSGAFVGGTVASAFLFGLKRAVFSNEAGQGSSPIAHSAVKTREPVREGVVAGLEPFIDTLVVCTFTALIILSTGVWNRGPDVALGSMPVVTQNASSWQFSEVRLPPEDWATDDRVMLIVAADDNPTTGQKLHRISGTVFADSDGFYVARSAFASDVAPTVVGDGIYRSYVGAALTARAFDSVHPGLGKWLISIAAWLFAISTIISWSYYGEQGVVYLAGEKAVPVYKLLYCLLIVVATLGLVKTDTDLDNLTGVGTAVLVFANLPICWIFGYQAMKAYKDYVARLRSGRMGPDHPAPTIEELLDRNKNN